MPARPPSPLRLLDRHPAACLSCRHDRRGRHRQAPRLKPPLRRTRRAHAAPDRRKPQPATAIRTTDRRTRAAAGQERTGALARRGPDCALEDPAASHLSKPSEAVSVHALARENTAGVEPEERHSLIAAARILDAKMRDVRGANRMAAVDRVAVLAALNLAHEL